MKTENDRRDFLKKCGLSTVPFFLPPIGLHTMPLAETTKKTPVNFIYDGLALSPDQYLNKLQEISKTSPIEADFYGNGGATKLLEEKFATLTGKEKAIYLPTGTMANQLAMKLLNKNNTKVLVPENSHIFRDEADAAQSVHNKRLIPVGKDKAYFDRSDLENTVNYINENEVFKSGLGTVTIENPVRRANGTFVPIQAIQEIADFCKQNGYKLHLDGARIHIAAAYSNISVAEYASHFDTVYISLYKYLNAAGGAILCGETTLIDQIAHQIKIYGGTIYQSWYNSSMAAHYLDGINTRWNQVVRTATQFISELNEIPGVRIESLKNGTNIYNLTLTKEISLKKLATFLYNEHNIWLGRADTNKVVKFTVNESLLTRDLKDIVAAWKIGIKQAHS